jgi:hypothetical protein
MKQINHSNEERHQKSYLSTDQTYPTSLVYYEYYHVGFITEECEDTHQR